MSIPGVHLTRIGKGSFLLEPLRSMNIADQGTLMQDIVAQVQSAKGERLYFDLEDLQVLDPLYYDWLDKLARTCQAVNIRMICINMQPTAAFTLSKYLTGKPAFEIARDISE